MATTQAPKRVISNEANMTFKAAAIPANVKTALAKQKGIVQKTSQAELLALLLEKPVHTFISTGNIVTTADLNVDNGLKVFATTVQTVKIPLNAQHKDMLNTLAKDTEITASLRFNKLRPVADDATKEAKELAANLEKFAVDYNGEKGFVVFDTVSW